MGRRDARQILAASVPVWIEDGPEWEDVLAHESVRGMHALLVHAIEQHGWQDPLEAAFDLLDSDSPRAEERLLTEALATWAEAAGAPLVPAPPESPGTLREWARQHGVEALLDRRVSEIDPQLAERGGASATLGDLYRSAVGPSRGRATQAPDRWVAGQVLELLHSEAFRRAQRSDVEDRLRDLETRAFPQPVGRLFERLTEMARELGAAAAIRKPPTPMTFRDDPPRFVPVRDAAAGTQPEPEAIVLHDGLVPVVSMRYEGGPAAELALVDGARLALGEPETARVVAETLSRPGWQRMLEGVASALAREGGREALSRDRLEWRIEALGRGDHVLAAYQQKPRKGGGFTKGRKIQGWQAATLPAIASTRSERLAVAVLPQLASTSFAHPSRVLSDVIESLIDARLVDGQTLEPVRVRRVAPRLSFEELEGSLVPRIRVGDTLLTPREVRDRMRERLVMVLEPAERPTVTIASFDHAQELVVRSLASRPAHVPDEPEPRAALAAQLPALAPRIDLDLPETLRGRAVPPDLRPLVRLDLGPGALVVTLGVRPLPGATTLRAGEGSPLVVSFAGGVPVHARRDLALEREREAEAIATLGLAPHRTAEGTYVVADLDAALEIVHAVQERSDALLVEWARAERPEMRALRPSDLRLRVGKQRDFWGLAGGAETELGRVDLGVLLRAAREGRRYVEIAPGAYARIEASLRDRLARADAHLREERGEHVFGDPAVVAIRDLGADGALDGAASFFDLVERVKRAREEEPVLDAPIAAVLRPYQRTGFDWLARLGAWGVGGVLADDMGLGKTLQALALLSFRAAAGPALVVAPTSVVGNWAREAERFAPELRVRVHRGSARERAVGEPGPGEVIVTSYDIAVRDADALGQVRFSTMILDEAQLVKNPATRRARAMRDVHADLKVALTGTPIENHLGELWSIFRIVLPQLLGSWPSFRARFAFPIERDGDSRRRAQLAELLRPFVLRRTKGEVAPELPPRTEMVREIDLAPEERELYERERKSVVDALARAAAGGPGARTNDDGARFAVLAALTKLRQLACDARLVHEEWSGPTSKLDELARLVVELKDEGHRVLVFSQFRRLLALAREALGAEGIVCIELTGETPAVERERRVDRFQAGGADAFLISLKAGGTGLNLTAATYVIHLDPWWNPAAEDQATDRAHRIGQNDPVTVYRLVSTRTIEEAVLSMHADKRALADGVLAGTDAAGSLDVEELGALLRHGLAS